MGQLTSRFDRAVSYARVLHGSDVRKGTAIPYLSHVLQVSSIALELGGNETEAIAALLHDAAEDAGGEAVLSVIESEFGAEVALIVRENSDSITASKEDKAPWRERKEAYVSSVAHKSKSACLVSISDKIHNLRSLRSDERDHGPAHRSRFNASWEDSRWYYASLLEAFSARLIDFPSLQRGVDELRTAFGDVFGA